MTSPPNNSQQQSVLVVEDDASLSLQLKHFLQSQGYNVTVASNRTQAVRVLSEKQFDLLLLDWKLPDGEGVDLCRDLREKGAIMPVLMLTAEAQLDDKLKGFDSGVDDYLIKPFSPKELALRVQTLLRRPPMASSDTLEIGPLALEVKTGTAYLRGEKLDLRAKEFALLEFLMRNPDRYFTTESLLAHVWTAEAEVGIATVRVQINSLKKKLADAGGLIQNTQGLGYKLAVPKQSDS